MAVRNHARAETRVNCGYSPGRANRIASGGAEGRKFLKNFAHALLRSGAKAVVDSAGTIFSTSPGQADGRLPPLLSRTIDVDCS